MKKIAIIFAALLILCAPCLAETAAPGAAYKILEKNDDAYAVEFPDVFSLELPSAWQEQTVSQEQADAGVIACFSDGVNFVSITRTDDTGEYADVGAYALAISDKYDSVSVNTLGGAGFACCVDAKNLASECATIIPGAGIYAFRFYPTGDADFAQTILDIMNTFSPVEVTGQ